MEPKYEEHAPYFPREEYELRYKKARGMMEKEGIDAILATDLTSYTYFGGMRSAHTTIDRIASTRARPVILILPDTSNR